MTGWAAVVYVCGALVFGCLVWLTVTTTALIRQTVPPKTQELAAVLASVDPDLIAVAVENPAVLEHAVSIDALPHAALVEKVLIAEQRELDLVEQIEEVRTDAVAVIADVMIQRDQAHAEAVRQAKAKKSHWSTILRLKGNS
jgi:hypothetical protein